MIRKIVSTRKVLTAAVSPLVSPLIDTLEARRHLSVAPTVAFNTPPSSGAEGTPLTIAATASEAGNTAPLTYGWTVYKDGQHFILPDGTNISGTSLNFTPTDNGNYSVRLTVLDNRGASTTINSAPIAVANVPPSGQISGTPPTGASPEGASLTLNIIATDPGANDTLTYAWTVTADGQSYALPQDTPTNGTSFTFTPQTSGTFLATCLVTDKDGAVTAVSTPAFEVSDVAPNVTLAGAPTNAINEGDLITLTPTVTDAGAQDTFTYAWSVTQDGQDYPLYPQAASTPVLAFNPDNNGTYVASLTVTDNGGLSASVSTQAITVNNVAPVAQIAGPISGYEGTPIDLTSVVTDPGSADTFTYAWSVTKDGSPLTLPDGTNAGSDFTFTPPDNGNYVVSLDVSDSDGAAAPTVTRNIGVLNVAPWVSVLGAPMPGQTANEGSEIDLTASALDPGVNDTETYQWSVTKDGYPFVLPQNTDSTDAAFAFTPDNEGAYVATIVVTDNDGGVTHVDTPITVINVAPSVTISGEPSDPINEGSGVSLTTTVTDPGWNDTDTYAWTFTKDGQAWTPPQDTQLANDTLQFIAPDNGTYIATATVTDNGGGIGTAASQPIIVDNVAPTPTITGAPMMSVDEASPLTFGSTVTDPGTLDTFAYAWSVTKDGNQYALPSSVNVNQPSFTFTPGHSGSYVVSLTVFDNDGGSNTTATSAFTVNNIAPTGAITGPTTGNEGSPLTMTANPIDGSGDTFTDAWSVTQDGTAVALPNTIVADQPTFTFTPDNQGAFVFSCTVTDDDGASVNMSSTVAVANVPPAVAISDGPLNAVEGSPIMFTSVATDPGVNDILTYGWSVKKDGQAYALPNTVDVTQPTLTFVPTDNGNYAVTLTVSDGDGGVTTVHGTQFTVADAPPIASIDDPGDGLLENQPVTLNSTVTDVSPEDTAAGFSYEWIATLNGQVADTGFDPSFTFTPAVHGTYTIAMSASDKDGGVGAASRTIVVGDVAPANVTIGNVPTSINEAQSTILTASADDAPDDSVSYHWAVTRNGGAISTAAGQTFTFKPGARGNYAVTLIATDTAGESTSTTQAIAVADVAPTVSLVAPKSAITLGQTALFKLSLGDVPKNQALVTTINFGDGTVKRQTFTGNQSDLVLNHSYAAAGTYSVTVSVSDGVDTSVVTKPVTIVHATRAKLTALKSAGLFSATPVMGNLTSDAFSATPSLEALINS